jgi:ankyrin repeat protein
MKSYLHAIIEKVSMAPYALQVILTKGMNKVILYTFFSLLSLTNSRAQSSSNTDSALNATLFQTIRTGDVEKLEAMLKDGANANATLEGYSALMAAALNGTAEEMKALIKQGANVNYLNKDSITALWLAVPNEEKTRLLLNNGAKADIPSREGNTVLVKLANIPGSAKLIQLLIDNGCNPRKSGPNNDVMCNAVSTDDTAIVGLLIRYGVSINDTSFLGDYPINYATNFRCFNTLKMLVDNGADVNVRPKTAPLPLLIGITPLMWTAVSNDKKSFYYLLEHNADVKAKSPRGYTPLMFLAMSEVDDPDMTRALIEHGAQPAEKALDDTDALYYAKLKGNTRSVEILSKYISKK